LAASETGSLPEPTDQPMGKLFFHMGVFAVVTFLVYLTCMFFVSIEDKREARRRSTRGS
jgi:hypothetical protein